MTWRTHQNITSATVGALRDIASSGEIMTVRGNEVRELRNRVTVLTAPAERCLFVPHRGHDVFAMLAETMWVLAGRSDVAWLSTFLKRAKDYSDDGVVWRAGYGPRFRNWNGIDQLDEVRRLLVADLGTRRAVMTLFDPDRDFVVSEDIPCNNWLHWLVRGGRLHLNVAVRSNDVWWGFSGVNAFEWSVLHELMACWIGVPAGEITYFASSLHLYKRHYDNAAKATASFTGVTCYDFGVPSARIMTPWERFDAMLRDWFEQEAELHTLADQPLRASPVMDDPFFGSALRMIRLKHGMRLNWDAARLRDELGKMPEDDLTAAAYEFIGREHPEVMDDIPHPHIAEFMTAYRAGRGHVTPVQAAMARDFTIALHREKDLAYGRAWKRRGELTSILANIARKVDRMDTFASAGTTLADESILDTALDLLVYLTKYRLFLLEQLPAQADGKLPAGAPAPFSDHADNFDALFRQLPLECQDVGSVSALGVQASKAFERLHALASDASSTTQSKLDLASHMGDTAWRLSLAIIREHPEFLESMRRSRRVSEAR